MKMLVLSLFPGIGLLDRAFEEEGFCIVRGPDLLWGGEVKSFHVPSGKFEGVIGGPPCQVYSVLRHLNPKVGRHGDQIPEFERIVAEAQPAWFVMENVREAPEPAIDGYSVQSELLQDAWVGGETRRLRRFSFGSKAVARFQVDTLALHRTDPLPAVCSDARVVPVAIGGSGKRKQIPGISRTGPAQGPRMSIIVMCERQGLPGDFFGEDSPFTDSAKRRMLGNGVPLPMGRAVARAVREAIGV
jgi:DNA (cytosine-5)-methyltransferase 1